MDRMEGWGLEATWFSSAILTDRGHHGKGKIYPNSLYTLGKQMRVGGLPLNWGKPS